MAVRGRLCFVSSWRISHFGINPVRGGRPPSERRDRVASAARLGALVHAVASVLILVDEEALRVRKAADVITMYVASVRSVSWGANCRTIIIHPRWAIEE